MRNKEREITDKNEINEIIQKAEVLRLGLAVNNTPYVVPVNFGYKDNCFYVHCAREGRKLDMIKQNNLVCFEMDVDAEITKMENPACHWSTAYRSVIGYGKASMIDDFDEKKRALDVIMAHYSQQKSFQYEDNAVQTVAIVKIEVHEISGKKAAKK